MFWVQAQEGLPLERNFTLPSEKIQPREGQGTSFQAQGIAGTNVLGQDGARLDWRT